MAQPNPNEAPPPVPLPKVPSPTLALLTPVWEKAPVLSTTGPHKERSPLLRRQRGRMLKRVTEEHSLGEYRAPAVPYTPERHEEIVAAYFTHQGNLAAVARTLAIPYVDLVNWRRDHARLSADLQEVEQIITEEAHGLFMRKVLSPGNRIPAWLIYFLKNHDPRYNERGPQQKRVEVVITDNTFGPRVIPRTVAQVVEAEVLDKE